VIFFELLFGFQRTLRSFAYKANIDLSLLLSDFLLVCLSKWADNSAISGFVKRLAQKKMGIFHSAFWRANLRASLQQLKTYS